MGTYVRVEPGHLCPLPDSPRLPGPLRGLDAAKALPGHLSLLDALELTLLAAETDADKIFEDCAARWLARVAVEQRLTLSQMMEAGQILQAAGRGEAGTHRALAELL